MRKAILFILLFFAGTQFVSAQTAMEKNKPSLLRHVVMFKFKDGANSEDIKKVEAAFLALPGKIKLIKDFEWGMNNSPEKMNQGLTHCFFLTFNSEKDRDAYLVHPAHTAFVEVLKPVFDKATVLDYWAHK
jgi:hypothetical protein